LVRLGFLVAPTSRSAAGADLLATTHDCNGAFSVQVKTKSDSGPWVLLGKHAKTIKSDSHIYVVVHLKKKKEIETVDYYIIPSKKLARLCVDANPNWAPGTFLVGIDRIQKYKSGWAQFGKST
jgi:hypothetical protein